MLKFCLVNLTSYVIFNCVDQTIELFNSFLLLVLQSLEPLTNGSSNFVWGQKMDLSQDSLPYRLLKFRRMGSEVAPLSSDWTYAKIITDKTSYTVYTYILPIWKCCNGCFCHRDSSLRLNFFLVIIVYWMETWIEKKLLILCKLYLVVDWRLGLCRIINEFGEQNETLSFKI